MSRQQMVDWLCEHCDFNDEKPILEQKTEFAYIIQFIKTIGTASD